MNSFTFTKTAKKAFLKLPNDAQERIILKLKSLKSHPDILRNLKTLFNYEPATHRLRVGRYRLILEQAKASKSGVEFLVLDVGDRKNI